MRAFSLTSLQLVKKNIQKLSLDIKLNWLAHNNEKIKKVNKSIRIIKKLNNYYQVIHR